MKLDAVVDVPPIWTFFLMVAGLLNLAEGVLALEDISEIYRTPHGYNGLFNLSLTRTIHELQRQDALAQ